MIVNAEITVVNSTKTTKAELLAAIETVPDNAVMRLEHHDGGRLGSDWYTVQFSWTLERGRPVLDA